MILRLVIAFTRWVWGVSPAFAPADSEMWYAAMCLGAIIDVAVVAVSAAAIIDWLKYGRSK